MVRPIVPPTVPNGTQRIRVCLHSGNTHEDVDGLVRRIREWLRNGEKATVQDSKLTFKSTL
jgi:8-amino-7-oxononanoate synthase